MASVVGARMVRRMPTDAPFKSVIAGVMFVTTASAVWGLPANELALYTAARSPDGRGPAVALVTGERSPLSRGVVLAVAAGVMTLVLFDRRRRDTTPENDA